MFWVFGCEACGILSPQTGIEPAPPALEGKILTTGLPLKSALLLFIHNKTYWQVCHWCTLYCIYWNELPEVRGWALENTAFVVKTLLQITKTTFWRKRKATRKTGGGPLPTLGGPTEEQVPMRDTDAEQTLGAPVQAWTRWHMMPAPWYRPPGLVIQGMKPGSPWYAALGRGQGQRGKHARRGRSDQGAPWGDPHVNSKKRCFFQESESQEEAY